MEPLIEKINRTIWAEQWRQARIRIDQSTLQRNLDSIRRVTSDFLQENSATNRFQAWTNLKSLVYSLFQELDNTGVSQIIGDVAREFRRDFLEFSYVQARDFRQLEENLVRLDNANIDWDTFWHFIDEHKQRAVQSFADSGRDYAFRRDLFPLIDIVFQDTPYTEIEMSPKKWLLGGVVSLGTFLGLVDSSAAIFTLGVSLLSFAGASVAAGYGAVVALGKDKDKK